MADTNATIVLSAQDRTGPALNAVVSNLNKVGTSAQQTSAQLRMVGPQVTDIVTSLASGQAPLTVFIQQGGQLKDMFGGVGAAARAVGTYVAGMINPLTVGAAALGAIAFAYKQGSAEADAYNRAIVLTGNTVGKTAGQMADMAARIDATVGTQRAAAAALAEIASTGKVAGDDLERFGRVAVQAQSAIGQSVQDTAKAFADLAKDPVEASQRLTGALGGLSAATFEQIRIAKSLGDESKAAALAQQAYADALENASTRLQANLGSIEKAWKAVKSVAAEAWDAMLAVGRAKTLGEQLNEVNEKLRQTREANAGLNRPMVDSAIREMEKTQAYLQEQIRLERRGAEAAAERAAVQRAGVEAVDAVTKANEKSLTKTEQMNKALADYRKSLDAISAANPNSALLDPAQIAKTEKAIRDQYKETNRAATERESIFQRLARSASERVGLLQEELEAGRQLTDAERFEIRIRNEMAAAGDKLSASEREQLEVILDVAKARANEIKINESLLTQAKEIAAVRQAARNADYASAAGSMRDLQAEWSANLKSVNDRARALADEAAAADLAARQNISLAQAVELVAIARLREQQAGFVKGSEGWAAREAEIQARQKLAAQIGVKAQRDEWMQLFTDIERGLTDSLFRGFEAGKDFFSSFWSGIKNTLKTTILKVGVQAVIGGLGLSGASLAAAAGVGGTAGAVGSIGSGLSLAGGINSLIGGASLFGSGFSSGLTAWSAGGSVSGLLGQGSALFSGGMANGLGTIAGALAPIALGIGAVAALFKSKTKELDAGISGFIGATADGLRTYRDLEKSRFFGLSKSRSTVTGELDPQVKAQLDASLSGIYTSVSGFADAIGLAAKDISGFTREFRVSLKDLTGDAIDKAIAEGLQDFSDALIRETYGTMTSATQTIEEIVQQYVQTASDDGYFEEVRRTIVRGVDSWTTPFDEFVREGESLTETFTRLGTAAKVVDEAFALLYPRFEATGVAAAALKAQLVEAFGTADNFNTLTSQYFQAFYSEEEQRLGKLNALNRAFAQLDRDGAFSGAQAAFDAFRAMPNRETFRQLVEAQDLTTASGARTYAQLLSLSQAVADLTPIAAAAEEAVQGVTLSLSDIQEQFASAAKSLLTAAEYQAFQIGQIQQRLAGAGILVTAEQIASATREQVIAGLGEVLAAGNLQAAAAILDVVDALAQVSTGFQQTASSARSAADILSERGNLSTQLNQLLGNTAALRAQELAALDPSNRALQEQIYAIQDAQSAIATLTGGMGDMQAAVNAAASEVARWRALQSTAGSILDSIGQALGTGGSSQEAALWAQLGSGTIDEQLQAARELVSLVTQRASVESDAQREAISNAQRLVQLGQDLRDYVQSLRVGSLSTLTPQQKLAQAQADYNATLAAARAGDTNAQGNLRAVADTFLQLAGEYDPASYNAVFASVTQSLDALGSQWLDAGNSAAALAQQQLDALGQGNTLSAEQIAKLQQLQSTVAGLSAQAATGQAAAQAAMTSAQANIDSLQAKIAAAQQQLSLAQAAANAMLANLPAAIVTADPTPAILLQLPANIAAALAPLIGTGAALPAGQTATPPAATGFDAGRAALIQGYAATLPQDETGARQLYDAAIASGVTSAELDAAMGWLPGTALGWALARGLPAFERGGRYAGGLALVGEKGPELINFDHPGWVVNADATRAALTGGGDLAAEMRAMLAELRALREQQAQETDAIVTIQGRCADKVQRAVSERRWSDELRPAVV